MGIDISTPSTTKPSKFALLLELFAHLPAKRIRQLLLLIPLVIVGALSEIIFIGSVVPLVSLMAAPNAFFSSPVASQVLSLFSLDQVSDPGPMFAAIFMLIVIVATLIRVFLMYVTNKLVFGLSYDVGVRLYTLFINQPYNYHLSRSSGEVLADFNKVQILTGGIFRPVIDGAVSVCLSAAIFAGLVLVNAGIAITSAALIGCLYALTGSLLRKYLTQNSSIIAGVQAKRVKVVQEGLGGIRDLILDGSQSQYRRMFAQVDSEFRNAQARNNFIVLMPRFLIECVSICLLVLLVFLLSRQTGGLTEALPLVGALALGAQRLLPLIQRIYQVWAQFEGNISVLEDVLNSLRLPLARSNRLPIVGLRFKNSLVLDQLGFAYHNEGPQVLKDISLTVPKGSKVGVVGESGSGKSTLMDLLMGLIEPNHGQIKVDGVSIDGANRRHWQRNIAHVPQHIYLADATLAENVAFGTDPSEIDFDRVNDAVACAQLTQLVDASRDGYNMLVGEQGVKLSGGQRQRIGIARALYKTADVLIFDEASSALDTETEEKVMSSISKLEKKITVFMVAHRLHTLRHCDLIIKLQNGKIAEVGDYDSLVGPVNQSKTFD